MRCSVSCQCSDSGVGECLNLSALVTRSLSGGDTTASALLGVLTSALAGTPPSRCDMIVWPRSSRTISFRSASGTPDTAASRNITARSGLSISSASCRSARAWTPRGAFWPSYLCTVGIETPIFTPNSVWLMGRSSSPRARRSSRTARIISASDNETFPLDTSHINVSCCDA
jgi:hypothetical protein